MSLEIVPMTLKEANAFVEEYHRRHGPVTGHKFSISCSDGTRNACSMLYGAAWRAARALRYKRLIHI